MIELPNKKYNIIYADPPWQYNDKRSGAGYKNPSGAGGAEKHYPTMSLEQICDMPVENIADENCMLFLWTTSSLLDYGFEVVKRWGFSYKTMGFVWVKMTKDYSKPYSGMGHYTNQNAEFCLLALKGSYWRQAKNVKQIIQEPRQKHSMKPQIVRKKIVELCGDLPRIELFARKESQLFEDNSFRGWDVWGDEIVDD
jgi:N6-adenosine-specific RNA methylase IME4